MAAILPANVKVLNQNYSRRFAGRAGMLSSLFGMIPDRLEKVPDLPGKCTGLSSTTSTEVFPGNSAAVMGTSWRSWLVPGTDGEVPKLPGEFRCFLEASWELP